MRRGTGEGGQLAGSRTASAPLGETPPAEDAGAEGRKIYIPTRVPAAEVSLRGIRGDGALPRRARARGEKLLKRHQPVCFFPQP